MTSVSTVASLIDASAASATPGAPDPTFDGNGSLASAAGSGASAIAVLPNGSLVVSGDASPSGSPVFRVTLFAGNGAEVATNPVFSGQANAVALTPSGNIVAAGYESNGACLLGEDPVVVELTPSVSGATVWSAALPCTSSFGGAFDGLAVDPSTGNIDAAGTANGGTGNEIVVSRFTANGTNDPGFASGEYVSQIGGHPATASAVSFSATTGDALVTGQENGSNLYVLALNGSGAQDGSFAGGGLYISPTSGTSGLGISVVAPGNPSPSAGTFFVAGGASGSSLLESFNSAGAPGWLAPSKSGSQFTSVAYQPNGNTVNAAGTVSVGQNEQILVAQYDANNGAANSLFGSGGASQSAFAGPASAAGVAVQTDGKVVAAGTSPGATAGSTDIGLFRVLGPSVSLSAPPVVQTTKTGPVTINYVLSLDEALYGNVPVVVCGPPGSNVANEGQCATITLTPGTTQKSVPVVVNVNYSAGNQQSFTTSAEPGGGVSPSPTHPAATTVVQHIPPPPPVAGYWMVAADGGVFAFHAPFLGSAGAIRLTQPVVGMATTTNAKGYWLVARDGGVFSYGNAHFYGSTGSIHLNQPIVGMAATADGKGYWLVARDGGIFAFGDARFFGSTGAHHLNQPIVGMAVTPDGRGYWLVASDGGIFAFGDARFHGSTGAIHLNKPIVGMTADPGASGYWLVASDGGIFTFGAARFHGSAGAIHLVRPIVGMAATGDGNGYWLVAADGGIFAFGDAPFFGSTGAIHLTKPIVGMAH